MLHFDTNDSHNYSVLRFELKERNHNIMKQRLKEQRRKDKQYYIIYGTIL